jgi:hypothetical protein
MNRKELEILIENKVRKILKEFRITPEMTYVEVCRDLFQIDRRTFDLFTNNKVTFEQYFKHYRDLLTAIRHYHYQYIIRSMAMWVENEYGQIMMDKHSDHLIDIIQLMNEFKDKILKLYK